MRVYTKFYVFFVVGLEFCLQNVFVNPIYLFVVVLVEMGDAYTLSTQASGIGRIVLGYSKFQTSLGLAILRPCLKENKYLCVCVCVYVYLATSSSWVLGLHLCTTTPGSWKRELLE